MSMRAPKPEPSERRVRLAPGGLLIGGHVVPLYAGSVHYFRLDPRDWRAALASTKALGLRLVDVYVPWSVHETAPGQLELGQADPQRDLGRFLRLAHELGMYAIVRPGPHINAELTCFGIPERVIWDPSCQARSPSNSPVMLPMIPLAFPVPSYASEAFHDEVARYFDALAPVLAPLRYPDGPIVAIQIDNEGALYFRDGAYDQDYHPDAVVLYRAFLRDKYHSLDALRAAYGAKDGADEDVRFATITPPTRFDAASAAEVARHVDWCEFHEHLLATAFERFATVLTRAGVTGIPTTHNLPLGQEATPLNAARVARSVDLVGLDYYHTATPRSRATIAKRTSELAVRAEGQGLPAFACEMGAGFPPFFPPLEERDSAFTVLTALAYGLRGFNVYMAVERDRWIGAPIDRRGRPRSFATFWRRLTDALTATSFHNLRRDAPVRLLTPRSERRLARVMHGFGPLTPAFFSVIGAGARERCSEEELGLGYPIAIEADTFAQAVDSALEDRGVPFAHIGGEDRDVSLAGARWIVAATSGGMNPELYRSLEHAVTAGAAVTLGPREPTLDGALRPLREPLDARGLARPGVTIPTLVQEDPAAIDQAVARAIEELGLPTYACDPDGIFVTVHHDVEGTPRVLFVLNPTEADVMARVTVPSSARRATDLIVDETFAIRGELLEARLPPKTVRMLALD